MSPINRSIVGSVIFVAVLLGAGAPTVQAAGFASTQISAIVSLLQSFGADYSVIAGVQAALNGTSVPATGGGGSGGGGGGQISSQPVIQPQISRFNRDLSFGARGNGVINLQEFLIGQGYYTGPISGYYGALVKQAVQRFQSANGIVPTGYFGFQSRGVANRIIATLPSITVTSPNGGERFVQGVNNTLSWQGGKNMVRLGLVKENATNQADPAPLIVGWMNEIDTARYTQNSIVWDGTKVCDLNFAACQAVAPGNYKLIASSQDASGNFVFWDNIANKPGNWDISNAPFSIVAAGAPSITVTSPNGGEQWTIGSTHTISWRLAGNVSGVTIELRKDGQSYQPARPIGGMGSGLLSFQWQVPETISTGSGYNVYSVGSGYRVRVYETGNPANYADSNAPFNIVASGSTGTVATSTTPTPQPVAGITAPPTLDFAVNGIASGTVPVQQSLVYGVVSTPLVSISWCRNSASSCYKGGSVNTTCTITAPNGTVLFSGANAASNGGFGWVTDNRPTTSGNYTLSCTSQGGTTAQSVVTNLVPPPPVGSNFQIDPIAPQTVTAGQVLSFKVSASGAADGTVGFSAAPLPAGAGIFRLGDVSMNRAVSSTDALYILQYATSTRTLSAGQKLLADINQDGAATSDDATLASQISAGSYRPKNIAVFVWTPSISQAGTYAVTVTATAGTTSVIRLVSITVNPEITDGGA